MSEPMESSFQECPCCGVSGNFILNGHLCDYDDLFYRAELREKRLKELESQLLKLRS